MSPVVPVSDQPRRHRSLHSAKFYQKTRMLYSAQHCKTCRDIDIGILSVRSQSVCPSVLRPSRSEIRNWLNLLVPSAHIVLSRTITQQYGDRYTGR